MNNSTPPRMLFTTKEKEKIFVGRTQTFWPEIWQQYVDLISHELWTKEQMAEYNFKKRLELLAYAYDNSPFYKRLYTEHGIHPNDIKTEADWKKLPIITKEMYRAAGEEIIVNAMRPSLVMRNTGGSTGEPLKVYDDRAIESLAILGRVQGWFAGRKPGDLFMPEQGLLGQDTVMLTRDRSDGISANKIRRWPQTWIYLDVWKINETTFQEYVKQIQSLGEKAYHMRAYTGAIQCLAQYCYDNNITLPRPISIHCVASVLSETTRRLVQKVFNQTLMDAYSSNELGPQVATEHALDERSHNLYIQDDLYHMEIVNDTGLCCPDEIEGSTVVTSFLNRVAPLIRYNQGDRSHHIRSEDPLNLPFSRIAPIIGRKTDFLITENGENHLGTFDAIFDDLPLCAKAFQYRQKEKGHVRLLVVPNRAHPSYEEEIAAVLEKLNQDCYGKLHFTLEYVDTIPHDGGKFRYIVHEH